MKEKIIGVVNDPQGWAIAYPIHDDLGVVVDLWCSPVVAWVVYVGVDNLGDARWAEPVSVDFISSNECPVLRMPDGTFVIPEDRYFADAAKLIKHWNDEEMARKIRKLAKSSGG